MKWVRIMVFNTTFNNISVISWRPVLLVEETGVLGENRRPVASHWLTLSHNVISSIPRLSGIELTTLVVIGTDCICSYKSNYHTITDLTTPDCVITYIWYNVYMVDEIILFLMPFIALVLSILSFFWIIWLYRFHSHVIDDLTWKYG